MALNINHQVNKSLTGIIVQYANISLFIWTFLTATDYIEILGYLLISTFTQKTVQDINYMEFQNTQTQMFG